MINDFVALAIARISYLKPNEKALLFDVVPDEYSFENISINDLSTILCRNLYKKSFLPRVLLEDAKHDFDVMKRKSIKKVLYSSKEYPYFLSQMENPPFMVYYRGSLQFAKTNCVSVVGTRAPTAFGRQEILRLCRELGEAGFSTVSGLARGIDTWVHRGSISGKALTAAVLGCGIDMIYPVSNKELAVKILESGGAILSEYPPGTPPYKWQFPERNRIIACLSPLTIVGEAPSKSGALITAQFALDEGRDVAVIASALESIHKDGALSLVKDGASVLQCAQDVLLHDYFYQNQ